MLLFWDDLKLFNNPITYRHVLQQDFEKIYKYSADWSLPLNLNKCVVLHLGKNNPHMSYIIGNIDLSHVFLFDEPLKGSKSVKIFKISLKFRFDKL
jgi:hypothetical protein